MELGEFLVGVRAEENLSLRELCTRAKKSKWVRHPISPAYLSRLERGGADHILVENVTLDKLWGVGVAIGVCPLLLFILSRPSLDKKYLVESERAAAFPVGDVPDVELGTYLRGVRHDQDRTLDEVARFSKVFPGEGFSISPSFLSQVETDYRGLSEKISGEKLWSLGYVFGVDPLALFVLSRKMNEGLNLKKKRSAVFRRLSI